MNKRISQLIMFVGLLFVSQTVLAAGLPLHGVLDNISHKFLTKAESWNTIITGYATWLFWTLAVISMVWTFGMMVLKKADIGEFFAEFVRFTIFTGFYLWLLTNGPNMAYSIIASMQQIGAEASGLPGMSPSTPIDLAFQILVKGSNAMKDFALVDNLAIYFITLAIMVCMGVVAANLLLIMINAWVMVYAGIFVLGFGGSKWTSDMAIGYFKAILGIGMKIMTMTLLVGVAVSIMDDTTQNLASNHASLVDMMEVFMVTLILAMLIHSVPNVVAGLIPGGGAAAGAGSFSTGAMMGAAVGAAAAVASGGAAAAAKAASAATGAAGGASAVKAAFQSAQSEGGGGSNVGGAMKKLAGGAKAVAADKISKSTGGKMASAIKAGTKQ